LQKLSDPIALEKKSPTASFGAFGWKEIPDVLRGLKGTFWS
jgi:hypothetical protein